MSETLEAFIVRRRGELDAEAERLADLQAAIDLEREQVNKVAALLAVQHPPHAIGTDVYVDYRARSPRRMSEATIKSMVLEILQPPSEGGTALQILDTINSKIEVPYPRTSLSPQLSRLKAEGKIHREGLIWKLGPATGASHSMFEDDEAADVEPEGAPSAASQEPPREGSDRFIGVTSAGEAALRPVEPVPGGGT